MASPARLRRQAPKRAQPRARTQGGRSATRNQCRCLREPHVADAMGAVAAAPAIRAPRAWAWWVAALAAAMLALLAWRGLAPKSAQSADAPPIASAADVEPLFTGIAGISGFAYSAVNDQVAYTVRRGSRFLPRSTSAKRPNGASPRLLLSRPVVFQPGVVAGWASSRLSAYRSRRALLA